MVINNTYKRKLEQGKESGNVKKITQPQYFLLTHCKIN